MTVKKIGLLPRILLSIVLGIGFGMFLPMWCVRLFATFNALFSELLGFVIPLIILGLVSVAIADFGGKAGKMLLITAALAYGFTVLSGLFSYLVANLSFPLLIEPGALAEELANVDKVQPYMSMSIPPLMGVMTALVLSFVLGIGMAAINSKGLKGVMDDFQDIVVMLIEKCIIPLLPLYIFGIFMVMTAERQVTTVLFSFLKVIGIIFLVHIAVLLIQYCIAGVVVKKNPLRLLWRMMPAYFTALGTMSSAATIPVTLEHAKRNGVRPETAGFVIPLCATIHLSGSTLKIVACAIALMLMQGISFDFPLMLNFILMLGITMVAAPGVPGGAIMAALGILSSILGFGEQDQALMIALYIAMDNFGTACNVTGDGALALIVDKMKV
ncbi:MAG: dicarboxylate/amino acid:cation symporter [Paludibacteraceae bacterium]|nr:dicarboxylate/amino acid:cation symporter [Paludibacteraceae bacterium]